MIKEGLERITGGYIAAKREDLKGHPLAKFIRSEFPDSLADAISAREPGSYLRVEGTKFMGAWARTPWIALLDTRITTTTQRGVYVVYAFSSDMRSITLALGIGTTNTSTSDRRALITHLQERYSAPTGFRNGPVLPPSGGDQASIPDRYDDAQIFYKAYSADAIPAEDSLIADLRLVLSLLAEIALVADPRVLAMASPEIAATAPQPPISYTADDVRSAFDRTTEAQWKNRPGHDPYWHVFIDGEGKPAKAVYRTLTNADSTTSFNTIQARTLFTRLGFECRDTRVQAGEHGKLDLLGTWRGGEDRTDDVRTFIEEHGSWASWWSFTIDEKAIPELMPPFYLYLNRGGGRIDFRLKVDDYRTRPGMDGMESPWPEITFPAHLNTTRTGTSNSGIFKTWFRVSAIERLEPPLTPASFTPFAALSDESNLLNQNRFGYVQRITRFERAVEVLPAYTLEQAMDGAFMARDEFEFVLRQMRRKKNVILQGPPGVGKTFLAKRLAYCFLGAQDSSRVESVQFHQSYTYEDFIQGYRPTDEGRFVLKDGVFLSFCDVARKDPANDYVFIVDEINRGNLSKIFGEVMSLVETEKRGEDSAIPLVYSHATGRRFSIPPNVFMLGLMNTADRSLAIVDYALRRRFAFVDIHPAIGSRSFTLHLENAGADPAVIAHLVERISQLNKQIDQDHELGSGYLIGHSYFCGYAQEPMTKALYNELIRAEVAPLIGAYWFDKTQEERSAIVDRLLMGGA